jgi:hypothetical protein
MVRDIRYVPKLATEIALCACQSNNQLMQQRSREILKLSSRMRRTKGTNDNNSIGHHYDDQSGSSCSSNSQCKTSKVDQKSLERAIGQLLLLKLEEKLKVVESLKKKQSKTTAASLQRCLDNEADDFDEIGSDDVRPIIKKNDYCSAGESTKCSREENSTQQSESKKVNNSPTASWSEFGSGPSISSNQRRNKKDENDDESVDGLTTAPIMEIDFSSGRGIPIYESDDPFDDD